MKSFLDYEKVFGIIKEYRDEHVGKFCDFRYNYHDLTIDDDINHAKATKELDLINKSIFDNCCVCENEQQIIDAVLKLAKAHSSETDKYNQEIRTIAEFLGIELPKESEDDEQ